MGDLQMSEGQLVQELNDAMDKMNALGAWELEGNAKNVLALLGISDPSMKIEAMSGGQARKVAVASALLGTPEVLILDEPTNHMDVQVRLCPFLKEKKFLPVLHGE
jgi:ABC transport system ATP-binding/permease protein